jgi:DNA-binding NarL/FixJ family response regulator
MTPPRAQPAAPRLTVREREVLLLLAGGASNNHVARTLGISLRTVKVHVAATMRALGVTDRTAAVVVALMRRLIRLGEITVSALDARHVPHVPHVPADETPHDTARRVPGHAPRVRRAPAPATEETPPSVRRILVVDDDEWLRLMLVGALEDEGWEVREAHDGGAALHVARGWRPHAILLDLMMAGMDGAAFAEAYARQRAPRAPILVITAAGPGAERAARQLPGVAAVMGKPLDVAALHAAVTELASHRGHSDQLRMSSV